MTKAKLITLAAAALLVAACGTTTAAARNGSDDRRTSTSTTTPSPTPTTIIDESIVDVRQIALARVGGGEVTEMQGELEHGRSEWKVRVVKDGKTYDVRVDAATGEVTRFDTNKDNSGHR
jgi:uncharacterized membrane protein YkoI